MILILRDSHCHLFQLPLLEGEVFPCQTEESQQQEETLLRVFLLLSSLLNLWLYISPGSLMPTAILKSHFCFVFWVRSLAKFSCYSLMLANQLPLLEFHCPHL